jgi:hypothetical protein
VDDGEHGPGLSKVRASSTSSASKLSTWGTALAFCS